MKKLIIKLFQLLWPEKRKWGSFEAKLKKSHEERLKKQMRAAMKNTIFHPPFRDTLSGSDEDTRELETLARKKFDVPDASNESIHKAVEHFLPDMIPHPELPKRCPRCFGGLMLSKKDNRVCACRPCSVTYLTKAANEDPNICADIAHCKAGIILKEEKLEDENENRSR